MNTQNKEWLQFKRKQQAKKQGLQMIEIVSYTPPAKVTKPITKPMSEGRLALNKKFRDRFFGISPRSKEAQIFF